MPARILQNSITIEEDTTAIRKRKRKEKEGKEKKNGGSESRRVPRSHSRL